jgi:hypothetical protein
MPAVAYAGKRTRNIGNTVVKSGEGSRFQSDLTAIR